MVTKKVITSKTLNYFTKWSASKTRWLEVCLKTMAFLRLRVTSGIYSGLPVPVRVTNMKV